MITDYQVLTYMDDDAIAVEDFVELRARVRRMGREKEQIKKPCNFYRTAETKHMVSLL